MAVLSPGGVARTPPRSRPHDLGPAPVLSDARRATLDAPSATDLPKLEPASDDRLVGRWVPEQVPLLDPSGPYVEFDARRHWAASNGGCNFSHGRFATAEGRFLTVFLGGSLVGCASGKIGLERFVTDAVWAGFDGSRLVLVDRDGRELVRLKAV